MRDWTSTGHRCTHVVQFAKTLRNPTGHLWRSCPMRLSVIRLDMLACHTAMFSISAITTTTSGTGHVSSTRLDNRPMDNWTDTPPPLGGEGGCPASSVRGFDVQRLMGNGSRTNLTSRPISWRGGTPRWRRIQVRGDSCGDALLGVTDLLPLEEVREIR